MNEKQREHFRQILLAWRQELMEEADRTMHHLQDEQANLPDPADRATQEEEFALELRTRDRERKLLKKIEKTLDLVDKDDYGYCEACGTDRHPPPRSPPHRRDVHRLQGTGGDQGKAAGRVRQLIVNNE